MTQNTERDLGSVLNCFDSQSGMSLPRRAPPVGSVIEMGESAVLISVFEAYCRRFGDCELTYDFVTFGNTSPITIKVMTAQGVPSRGITTAFVLNLPELGYDTVLVAGWRGTADLVTAVGSIAGYLVTNSMTLKEGLVVEGAFELEVEAGILEYEDAMLTQAFPWKGIDERADEAGLRAIFFILPITREESRTLKQIGLEEFE